jgi:Protein of unknown function (DUF1566)
MKSLTLPKEFKMRNILGLTLALLTPACIAANPASTAYVDRQFAAIQAQIDTLAPSLTHPVGSCYGGGVVFYRNPDLNAPAGQRGLIVAPSDSDGTTNGTTLITGCSGSPVVCRWDTTGNTLVVGTESLYFTGEENTQDILDTPTFTGTWSAAEAAEAYNTTNPPPTCEGCTAWYLPAQDELATLYFQSHNMPGFGADCTGFTALAVSAYWSSTQLNDLSAWFADFSNGKVTSRNTDNQLQVRPVRAF